MVTPPQIPLVGLSAGFKIAAKENLGWRLEDKHTHHLLWVVMVQVELRGVCVCVCVCVSSSLGSWGLHYTLKQL